MARMTANIANNLDDDVQICGSAIIRMIRPQGVYPVRDLSLDGENTGFSASCEPSPG
jgi:hypothetical protein